MRYTNNKAAAQLFLMTTALQCIAVRTFSRVCTSSCSRRVISGSSSSSSSNRRLRFLSTSASAISSSVSTSTTQLGVKSKDQSLEDLDAALESILSGVATVADDSEVITAAADAAPRRTEVKTREKVRVSSVPAQYVEKVSSVATGCDLFMCVCIVLLLLLLLLCYI